MNPFTIYIFPFSGFHQRTSFHSHLQMNPFPFSYIIIFLHVYLIVPMEMNMESISIFRDGNESSPLPWIHQNILVGPKTTSLCESLGIIRIYQDISAFIGRAQNHRFMRFPGFGPARAGGLIGLPSPPCWHAPTRGGGQGKHNDIALPPSATLGQQGVGGKARLT